jgi:hypothetical protein
VNNKGHRFERLPRRTLSDAECKTLVQCCMEMDSLKKKKSRKAGRERSLLRGTASMPSLCIGWRHWLAHSKREGATFRFLVVVMGSQVGFLQLL